MATINQSSLAELYPSIDMNTIPMATVDLSIIESTDLPASRDLIDAMRQRGQLQPVILTTGRRSPEYGIVDGRRRVAAARHLGWKKIRAQVLDLDPLTEAATAITANAIRSSNPISDLQAIRTLQDAGYSESEIAAGTGLPVGTIRKRLKLLNLPGTLLDAVEAGQISIGVGQRIAAATPEVQNELSRRFLTHERITGADLREASSAVRASAAQQLGGLIPAVPARSARERFVEEAERIFTRYTGELTYAQMIDAMREAWEGQGNDR